MTEKKLEREVENEHGDTRRPSELERMTDLTRRIVNVPVKELAKAKQRDEKRRGH